MNYNRTELCDECNSHIIKIKTPTNIIYECSYCGLVHEEINPLKDENYE